MPVKLIRTEQGYAAADVQMSWSAIFSGAFLILGFGFFFLLLGNAVGLNALNTIRADVSTGWKVGSWIYMAVTFIFSYFLGAFLCTRTLRINTPMSGMLHGLTAWGLATAVLLIGGSIGSVGVRFLLAGMANDSANWLAICIVGVGGFLAAVGGLAGKYSQHHAEGATTVEERRIA